MCILTKILCVSARDSIVRAELLNNKMHPNLSARHTCRRLCTLIRSMEHLTVLALVGLSHCASKWKNLAVTWFVNGSEMHKIWFLPRCRLKISNRGHKPSVEVLCCWRGAKWCTYITAKWTEVRLFLKNSENLIYRFGFVPLSELPSLSMALLANPWNTLFGGRYT